MSGFLGAASRIVPPVVVIFSLCFGGSTVVWAQTAANVAVIINEDSPASVKVGEYYARKRGVPEPNVIRIRTPTDEQIPPLTYAASIELPIARALGAAGLQDRILYIVLTKGIPLKIAGSGGLTGASASVDSELTFLYRKMTGRGVPLPGPAENPYYLRTGVIADATPFSHRNHDLYLVTRLDGFTVEDAMALVDRAQTPLRDGRIVFDRRSEPPAATGDLWMAEAAAGLKALGQGDRVELLETVPAAGLENVLGYYSWGSSDPANRRRDPGLRFAAGSIVATLAGSDARTMSAPPEQWQPSDGRDRSKAFAGSYQSLIGDLVRAGATGAAGYISDPLLAGAVRPQVLFAAYLSGFNLAEAYYLSLPQLSWKSVILGDPLCRPFEGRVLTASDIEEGLDERTGLPRAFSNRRIEVLRSRNPDLPPEILPLMVRAEVQSAADKGEARATLEEVAKLAPKVAEPQMQLAMLYEESKEFGRATELYRRILEVQPNNVLALNNLAYRLAIDKSAMAEALALAQKAAALAPQSAAVADTLGWILHLSGDNAAAAKHLGEAVRRNPKSAEIRLHNAIVSIEVGAYAAAETHLAEALKLDPSLETRDEVRDLRARLAKRR